MTPFYGSGKTYAIPLVSGVASTPIVLSGTGIAKGTIRLFNTGTQTAYVAFGKTSIEAAANCVKPTSGNPKYSIGIPAGAVEILSINPNQYPLYVSALSDGDAGTLEVTEGRGI